jgi:hypothetical protein
VLDEESWDGGAVELGRLLAHFPVALLAGETG